MNLEIQEAADLVQSNNWNEKLLQDNFSSDIGQHIMQEIPGPTDLKQKDRLWWGLTTNGKFAVRSAWYIRYKEHTEAAYKCIWVKKLPFKVSFFMWRLWKFKLPTDDRIARMG